MTRSTHSTSPLTHTKSSVKINSLRNRHLELRYIKTSDSLWRNLIHYADPHRSEPVAPFDKNTLGVADGERTEASPQGTALGVMAIHAAAQALAFELEEEIVNSQQSVHDSAYKFISTFTRFAIMQRYANIMLPDNGRAIPLQHQLGWRGNVVKQDQQIVIPDRLAGLADGILQSGVEENKNTNGILFAKPSWGYGDLVLDEIYNGKIIGIRNDGKFSWDGHGVAYELLRQLWGSLVIMDCNFAIWTNGEKLFLALRTDQNELVVTHRETWAEHDTAKAIIGLTYAALDEKKWKAKNVDILAALVGETVALVPPVQ